MTTLQVNKNLTKHTCSFKYFIGNLAFTMKVLMSQISNMQCWI